MNVCRRKLLTGGLIAGGAIAVATIGGVKVSYRAKKNNHQSSVVNSESKYRPRYLDLEASGELAKREAALWDMYAPCTLCPRMCGVNRRAGRGGKCRFANSFRVASFGPDFGNEAPIRGTVGSGSVFLSGCNLKCIFCQNWQINHRGDGQYTTHEQLADMLISMQNMGCHNVSFITPTHLLPHLITGLRLAIARGLNIPLCYNTGGYESLKAVKLLDGIVDIYQPDFKFQDAEIGARLMQGAMDYPRHARAAIKEMHRQVGNLTMDENGLATHGVVIRHLVLPENAGGADKLVKWIVKNFGPEQHVNIMGQFWPAYRSRYYPPLNRALTRAEYTQAMDWARAAGLRNFL
ncbi:MAG: radical SAM protein [Alphaproteobacteria bacterium]|nr:radical SAM protein [Alphaproteobacteria bacterium]